MIRFNQSLLTGFVSRNPAFHKPFLSPFPMKRRHSHAVLIGSLCLALLAGASDRAPAFDDVEVGAILRNPIEASDFPGYPGVIMAHQSYREITGSGSGLSEEHLIGRIFDPEEAESSLGQWSTDLDRELQFIEVVRARIYRGDEIKELGPDSWDESPLPGVPEKGYPKRTRFTIHFQDIRSGDLVEIHTKIHITPDPERYPVAWGVYPLCRELPIVERQIILSAPVASKIMTKIQSWPGQVARTYKGSILLYGFHTGNLPALGSLEGTIDPEEGPPCFMFSNMENWERVGFILAREFEWATTTASVGIQDSVRAFTKGKSTSRERLLALLDLMDQKIGRAPLPSDLLRYWPRSAAATFSSRWADPQDWICLLRAMGSYVGLPSQVEMIAPRADWVQEDNANPQQLPHIALKIRLPDEGTNLLIDPLRRPAGLEVSPFPGSFYGLAPIPKNPITEIGEPLPADRTRLTLDLSWDPAGGSDEWTGSAHIEGTGMAAAWIVQNLGGWHSEYDVPLPVGAGWEPILDSTPPPTLVENWAASSATTEFRWRQPLRRAGEDSPAVRILSLLPTWRDLLETTPSSSLRPEGPMTWTTRLQIPSEFCPGAGNNTWNETSKCGSWKISMSLGEGSTLQFEEVLVWEPGEGCTGTLQGLEAARRKTLGIEG
ncbi:MAG: DUF3857 domain-containing protein [Candidatus Eisenbacteria bacterium]|uniref:DUF3857 domain-containing protein n=1 Tax=Eiseniibacteriota bacterium TaxID=2212470 RepID=A0A948RV87_UNCEI|nr:DUF3857 domain-containing protein [Candidatus Eisenbacteria bacterium]MBU1949254.1 DUF3857 domain-containing protein [Candidatus Eisenbacteria bacterium]MBU2689592.1 DUF3857 domain-containing protein [Candidatus Eisenbacteria bacterium]